MGFGNGFGASLINFDSRFGTNLGVGFSIGLGSGTGFGLSISVYIELGFDAIIDLVSVLIHFFYFDTGFN